MVAAKALGLSRAALEVACDYGAQGRRLGDRSSTIREVASLLADMFAQLSAARLLTWRAARMAAQGGFV
jgi:acyl-CoA dehydrogenase